MGVGQDYEHGTFLKPSDIFVLDNFAEEIFFIILFNSSLRDGSLSRGGRRHLEMNVKLK